ncbi:MAG: hypothetical protein BA863_01585 [Desulfovibrio sp. S3730MH75]|nr:MAG: hypothetical protein BA863_01585 [Desulfovibrio sp. S3730MH75]
MSKAKIHPILFNTSMVRAIMDGRKTQTRRVVKSVFKGEGQPTSTHTLIDIQKWEPLFEYQEFWWNRNATGEHEYKAKPLYSVGDILWVRESGRIINHNWDSFPTVEVLYLADESKSKPINVPPRFFNYPRWIKKQQGIPNGIFKEACRTWLKVTNVRAERIQAISWNDAIVEGIDRELDGTGWMYYGPERIEGNGDPRVAFKQIWDSIYTDDAVSFYANPWVWVYRYELCDRPEGWNA